MHKIMTVIRHRVIIISYRNRLQTIALFHVIVIEYIDKNLDVVDYIDLAFKRGNPFLTSDHRRRRRLKRYPLQARHKQDWGRGFIILLPQTAALPESDAGSDVIKPASSFVIQNRQTACSMWCPMYRARC